jgi:hypothetical protein
VTLPSLIAPLVRARAVVALRRHDPHALLQLSLGLPLRDRAGLAALLAGLRRQGPALSRAQFAARFGPRRDQVAAVVA